MGVYVILANGFEEIEAITVIDILRRAKVDVKSVSITGKKEVTGAHAITVFADFVYEEVNWADGEMLILPGGMPGTSNIGAHDGIINTIKDYVKNQKWIAAICAAPSVLGKMGVLEGVEATCYPGYENTLKGAIISSNPVVKSHTFITSVGPGTALMFSLTILEVLKGTIIADEIKNNIIITQK